MGVIGTYLERKFEVSADVLRGFTDLNIKAAAETKEKTASNQTYVTFKSSRPAEMSINVRLIAQMGTKPREEADAFLESARKGEKGYFYVGDKKLLTCQMMLTECSVFEVELSPSGKWRACTIKLVMKQCSKYDGTTGGGGDGGSGGGGGGTKRPTVKQPTDPVTDKPPTPINGKLTPAQKEIIRLRNKAKKKAPKILPGLIIKKNRRMTR